VVCGNLSVVPRGIMQWSDYSLRYSGRPTLSMKVRLKHKIPCQDPAVSKGECRLMGCIRYGKQFHRASDE